MKIESWTSTEEKRLWKIVRTIDYTDVPGEIVDADDATGECSVSVPKLDDNGLRVVDASGHPVYETKTFCFGLGGIRIVPRG